MLRDRLRRRIPLRNVCVRLKFKRLTIRDYDALVRLWSRAGLPFKPKVRDSRTAIGVQMRANPHYFVGAYEDERLVGAVMVSSDLRKGWINRLAVDPDFRRRGVALALIREAEHVLKADGIKIFCAQIEVDNVVSMEVFRKAGYVEHNDIVYFSKRESADI
jgi:ribosomal protein S18 acetylase RimI-like enzyme